MPQPMHNLLGVLSRIPLFTDLPSAELRWLAVQMRQMEAPTGTVLFREGDAGNHFYIIIDGQVDVIKALNASDERVMSTRTSGDFVGEMSLINPDGLRTATVRCRNTAHLLELTRAGFDALLERSPMLAYAMARHMSARLTESQNAALREMEEINRQLRQANAELIAAQAQIVEKERLDRELQLAYEIQMSLLPKETPSYAGWSLGACLQPARTVGGDMFDFIPISPRQVGVLIGDVSDKGVPAAIFMAQAHALLYAEAHRGTSPAEVLGAANRHLRMMNSKGMFVTVVYGVLDVVSRQFTFSVAGHEMPLLCDGNALVQPLQQARAMPLGLWDDPQFHETTLVIPRGGVLLLSTDGVTDAQNAAEERYGIYRLRAELLKHAHMDAQPLCDELVRSISAYSAGAPQADDIAVVAVSAQQGVT